MKKDEVIRWNKFYFKLCEFIAQKNIYEYLYMITTTIYLANQADGGFEFLVAELMLFSLGNVISLASHPSHLSQKSSKKSWFITSNQFFRIF
jgi:hypothetical protein